MKLFILVFGLWSAGAWAQQSELKGLRKISLELSTRIAAPDQILPLTPFVPAPGLEALLGTWSTFANDHVYHNGNSNPVNMVIWNVIASRFADALAASCVRATLPFSPAFTESLNALCAGAASDAALTDYWLFMMGYDAPEDEFVAWRDFFSSAAGFATGAEAVRAMSFAILMNPYFILDK